MAVILSHIMHLRVPYMIVMNGWNRMLYCLKVLRFRMIRNHLHMVKVKLTLMCCKALPFQNRLQPSAYGKSESNVNVL